MPLYRLEARAISRHPRPAGPTGVGTAFSARRTSVTRCAAYRAGVRLVGGPRGEKARSFDYSRRVGVVHAAIQAPDRAPSWMRDRRRLWRHVDDSEVRRDALLARELIVTLPRAISLADTIAALETWVGREVVAQGMVADVCIHAYGSALDPTVPANADALAEMAAWPVVQRRDGENPKPPELARGIPHLLREPDGKLRPYQPHAHILLTTRVLTEGGFGEKERDRWGKKKQLYAWRQSWETTYNALLSQHRRPEQVTAKAAWRRAKDTLAAADVFTRCEGVGTTPPVKTVNLDGQHFAARKPATIPSGSGRFKKPEPLTPAGTPRRPGRKEPLMRGTEFNQALAALRGQPPAPPTASQGQAAHERVMECMADISELQRQGVRFFRTSKNALGFADPGKVMSKARYKQFGSLHEEILELLEQAGQPAAPRPAAPPSGQDHDAGHTVEVELEVDEILPWPEDVAVPRAATRTRAAERGQGAPPSKPSIVTNAVDALEPDQAITGRSPLDEMSPSQGERREPDPETRESAVEAVLERVGRTLQSGVAAATPDPREQALLERIAAEQLKVSSAERNLKLFAGALQQAAAVVVTFHEPLGRKLEQFLARARTWATTRTVDMPRLVLDDIARPPSEPGPTAALGHGKGEPRDDQPAAPVGAARTVLLADANDKASLARADATARAMPLEDRRLRLELNLAEARRETEPSRSRELRGGLMVLRRAMGDEGWAALPASLRDQVGDLLPRMPSALPPHDRQAGPSKPDQAATPVAPDGPRFSRHRDRERD